MVCNKVHLLTFCFVALVDRGDILVLEIHKLLNVRQSKKALFILIYCHLIKPAIILILRYILELLRLQQGNGTRVMPL